MTVRHALSSLAAAAALAAAAPSHAQRAAPELNGYLTLASGYWDRGLSQNDGPSLQLGIDYQRQSGLFVGASAVNVDYAMEYSEARARTVEAEGYVGFNRKRGNVSFTATLGRYVYPRTGGSYDYNEWSGTVGFRDRLFYTAAYASDFYALGRRALDQQLSMAWPLRGNVELGATVGHFALADTAANFSHWNIGASKVIRRVVLDLRYYDSGYEGVGYLGAADANHYVLSVSYALRGARPRL